MYAIYCGETMMAVSDNLEMLQTMAARSANMDIRFASKEDIANFESDIDFVRISM